MCDCKTIGRDDGGLIQLWKGQFCLHLDRFWYNIVDNSYVSKLRLCIGLCLCVDKKNLTPLEYLLLRPFSLCYINRIKCSLSIWTLFNSKSPHTHIQWLKHVNACDTHNNIYFCSHYKYIMTSRTPKWRGKLSHECYLYYDMKPSDEETNKILTEHWKISVCASCCKILEATVTLVSLKITLRADIQSDPVSNSLDKSEPTFTWPEGENQTNTGTQNHRKA